MNISVTSLSDHTGAAVTGVDLSKPVDVDVQAQLNKAFVEHSVLVVRDQSLTPNQMLDAVQLFGDVFHQQNTRFALPECPDIHYISNQDKYADGSRYIPGGGFHTDQSNAEEPPKATVLFAVELPDRGGDTQYFNLQEAYDDLPADMKARIEGLKAVQVYQNRHSTRKLMGLSTENKAKVAPSVIHPIVRTHPESRRKGLYINPIRIDSIVGMDDSEALPLLDDLLAHATQDKFEYRHQWRAGDLVMWDNRCLLHKANADYDMDQMRYLYRVMLRGDRPS
jgi:taurine dioxygenase